MVRESSIRNSQANLVKREKGIDVKTAKEAVSSLLSFFSIMYVIILAASMSYNIGYFKYINPQMVDLMTLNDYVDDTIHNIWFFLLGALLFFSSSLAFIKNKENQPDRVVTFGVFVLIISVYFLSRGVTSSKFWPTLKVMLLSYDLMPLFIVAGLALLILVTYTSYRLATDIRHGRLPDRYIAYMPLIIFILLVLAPYLSGLVESKIERERLSKDDYTIQSVDIITDFAPKRFKDIIILKKLDKGLILRVFTGSNDDNHERFVFINWGGIKQIIYKDAKNSDLEIL